MILMVHDLQRQIASVESNTKLLMQKARADVYQIDVIYSQRFAIDFVKSLMQLQHQMSISLLCT